MHQEDDSGTPVWLLAPTLPPQDSNSPRGQFDIVRTTKTSKCRENVGVVAVRCCLSPYRSPTHLCTDANVLMILNHNIALQLVLWDPLSNSLCLNMTASIGAQGLIDYQARTWAKHCFSQQKRESNDCTALFTVILNSTVAALIVASSQVADLVFCTASGVCVTFSCSHLLVELISRRYRSLYPPENEHQYNKGWR